jgi:hypothetical protein
MVALILEQGAVGREIARRALADMPHASPEIVDNCVAVGIASGNSAEDKLMGAVLYHSYDPGRGLIEVSAVIWNPRCVLRGALVDVYAIPFLQYGVRKMYTFTPHTNERALRFNRGLGFKQEAVLRHHFGPKLHGVVCSLMRGEYDAMCRRFKRGNVETKRAA